MSHFTLYFENSLASISTHTAAYVQLTYHAGTCTEENLREVLQHTGNLLQRRRWHRLLEDQQQLPPLSTEQQLMITRYWKQQMPHLPYSLCVAAVQAQNVFARLAAASLRHALRAAAIDYNAFDTLEAASSWLQTQAGRAHLGL